MTRATTLLLATRNEGKLRELRDLLSDLPLKLIGLAEVEPIDDVFESGDTFAENAALKATGYASQSGLLTLSDDSGLEVDALGGNPGIRSARYVSQDASDVDRVQRLLAEIRASDPEQRTARFVSVVAIADSHGVILNSSRGVCVGRISFEPHGEAGFGYDPVFIPDGYDETFAELQSQTKNMISHRSEALRSAREFLTNLTSSSGGR